MRSKDTNFSRILQEFLELNLAKTAIWNKKQAGRLPQRPAWNIWFNEGYFLVILQYALPSQYAKSCPT